MAAKKNYSDFDSLAKFIKKELVNNSNFSCRYRKISDVSKEFFIDNKDQKLIFELNFFKYDKNTNNAELYIKFENKKYKISYIQNKYYLEEKNLDSLSLLKIINDEYKTMQKYIREDYYPYSFKIQTLNSVKPVYPIETVFFCPECKDGKLQIKDEKSLLKEEHKTFNQMVLSDYKGEYDDDWFKYSFTGFMTCKKCNEKIAVLGDLSYYKCFREINEDECDCLEEEEYIIKYFDRVKDFIDISGLQNEELKQILKDSFLLYYSDLTSCANKIRAFLDMYLTELGVPETQINGNFYPLAKRIEDCKKLDKTQKNTLKVLKDVGNEGSHGGGIISYADIYITYKVLEEIINQNTTKKIICKLKSRFSK